MRIPELFVAGFCCLGVSAAQAANLGAAGAAARSGPTAAMATGVPSPNLVYSFVSVQKTTYAVTSSPRSIVVYDFQRDANACKQPFSFPLQLIVKNIGSDFTPRRDVPQNAAASILPYFVNNNRVDLHALRRGESQVMNFNVSLPPGQYTLWARILDKVELTWPLEVKCDTHSLAPTPIPAPALNGGFGSKRPAPAR